MKLKWILLTLLLLVNCAPDLDTTPHKITRDIEKDLNFEIKWRLISYSQLKGKISISCAWNIVFRNNSKISYHLTINEFKLEDEEGFQITSYKLRYGDPIVNVTVSAGQSIEQQGNFSIDVGSLKVANSIKVINPSGKRTEL